MGEKKQLGQHQWLWLDATSKKSLDKPALQWLEPTSMESAWHVDEQRSETESPKAHAETTLVEEIGDPSSRFAGEFSSSSSLLRGAANAAASSPASNLPEINP